jgi:hypothetical protein
MFQQKLALGYVFYSLFHQTAGSLRRHLSGHNCKPPNKIVFSVRLYIATKFGVGLYPQLIVPSNSRQTILTLFPIHLQKSKSYVSICAYLFFKRGCLWQKNRVPRVLVETMSPNDTCPNHCLNNPAITFFTWSEILFLCCVGQMVFDQTSWNLRRTQVFSRLFKLILSLLTGTHSATCSIIA